MGGVTECDVGDETEWGYGRNPRVNRIVIVNRVFVIGSTGRIGREVVAQLEIRDTAVRALTRDPEAAKFSSKVELVRGDLTSPSSLDAHLDGVDAVFLVWTAPPVSVAQVLERIAKRVRRIVFLSAPLKTPHPLFQQPNPRRALAEQIERLIESSGMEWTFLRPGMFAANALGWWAPQIRADDVVRWPHLTSPSAPVAESDIAAIAVRALCDQGHAGAEYVLTGPQSLTQFEQISLIGRAVGRPLRIEEISPDEARREFAAASWSPSVVNMLLDAWAAAIGSAAFVTSTFEEITGKPAMTFQQWAVDHAAEFRHSG